MTGRKSAVLKLMEDIGKDLDLKCVGLVEWLGQEVVMLGRPIRRCESGYQLLIVYKLVQHMVDQLGVSSR